MELDVSRTIELFWSSLKNRDQWEDSDFLWRRLRQMCKDADELAGALHGVLKNSKNDLARFYHICLGNAIKNQPPCFDVLMLCGGKIMKILAQTPESNVTREVFDYLFQKILAVDKKDAKPIVQRMFETAGYELSNVIEKLLMNALIPEDHSDDDEGYVWTFSPSAVYFLIYELLLINKDLVPGLVNRIDLSLESTMIIHLAKLEFLCKLFSDRRIHRAPNTARYYSTLYTSFLKYCRKKQCISLEECQVLCSYTPNILKGFNLRRNWCLVLQHRIGLDSNQSIYCYIDAILSALRPEAQILYDDVSSEAISSMLLTMINPNNKSKWGEKAWRHLSDSLVDLYRRITEHCYLSGDGFTREKQESAMVVLNILLSPCRHLDPSNDNWLELHMMFQKIVFSEKDCEKHMERMLNLWILAGDDNRSLIQVMLHRNFLARYHFNSLLNNQRPYLVVGHFSMFLSFLPSKGQGFRSLFRSFCSHLQRHVDLKGKLKVLLSNNICCNEKEEIIGEIYKMINPKEDKEEFTVFLAPCILVLGTPCKTQCLKNILEITNSWIHDNKGLNIYQMSNVCLQKLALQLVNEILYLTPHVGFSNHAVNKLLLSWSNHLNSSISYFALRCISTLSSDRSLTSQRVIKGMVDGWMLKVETGSWQQLKMAMRCIAKHLIHPDDVLNKIFEVISRQLSDPTNEVNFERAVFGLGHFAALCPSSLKPHIENLCMNKLLGDTLIASVVAADKTSSVRCGGSSSNSNVWVDWGDLSFRGSLLVRALRSVGRCMRFCASSEKNLKVVFDQLEEIIITSSSVIPLLQKDSETDRVRLEAACALLNILEVPKHGQCLSTRIFLVLSCFLTESREEVRQIFAQKLCRGLSPHKSHANERGRSKGAIHCMFLGFLPLLGLESYQWAEEVAAKILLSRRKKMETVCRVKGYGVDEFHGQGPMYLVENLLAFAIPILASHPKMDVYELRNSKALMSYESFRRVGRCFSFILNQLQESRLPFIVSKDSMRKLIIQARETIKLPSDKTLSKKYLAVWEVLHWLGKKYSPTPTKTFNPVSFYFSRRFFEEEAVKELKFNGRYVYFKPKFQQDVMDCFREMSTATADIDEDDDWDAEVSSSEATTEDSGSSGSGGKSSAAARTGSNPTSFGSDVLYRTI